MRKKLDANDDKQNMAEPNGTASEPNGAQIEFEIALDPGSDVDPEGWMGERSDYWTQLGHPKKFCGAAHWIAAMRSILARLNPLPSARRQARLAQATELTHEEWARLSESALGPLHPARLENKDCASPNTPLGRKALPNVWKTGALMSATVDESAMPVAAKDEKQAPSAVSNPESTTLPEEPPRGAPRRRGP